MTDPSATPARRWRDGMHPDAEGMRIVSLERVDLPLGEALRMEMGASDPAGGDVVHIQYFIATDAGGWALWISCARADVAAREAALRTLPPAMEER